MVPWADVLAVMGPLALAYAVAVLAEALLDAVREMWR